MSHLNCHQGTVGTSEIGVVKAPVHVAFGDGNILLGDGVAEGRDLEYGKSYGNRGLETHDDDWLE